MLMTAVFGAAAPPGGADDHPVHIPALMDDQYRIHSGSITTHCSITDTRLELLKEKHIN